MAIWLADQVGNRGSVLAVDPDVTLLKHLSERPNVTIVETALEDLDLPRAKLDLIHTRNVLMHIDSADQIIAGLVEALRPGGVLLLEEADYFPLAGMTSSALFEVASALVAKWTWAANNAQHGRPATCERRRSHRRYLDAPRRVTRGCILD